MSGKRHWVVLRFLIVKVATYTAYNYILRIIYHVTDIFFHSVQHHIQFHVKVNEREN